MDLSLLKIAAIPIRLIELNPGYSQADLRAKAHALRRDPLGEGSIDDNRVPVRWPTSPNSAGRPLNVGEGRAL